MKTCKYPLTMSDDLVLFSLQTGENMQYYLNTPPPFSLLKRLSILERAWQIQGASPPHLTLVNPRKLLPEKTERELVAHLYEVRQKVRSFPVRLLGVGSFNEKENIHVCVERTEALVHCHEELTQVANVFLAPRSDAYANMPHPHISIVNHLAMEQREAAWQALSKELFSETFPCTHIQLMRRGPSDQKWILVCSFTLS